MSTDLQALEVRVLARGGSSSSAPAIFVLGAPRTGSTFLYQALVSAYRLPFIDNLTDEYLAATPALGTILAHGLRGHEPIRYTSRYGKVDGLLQPSEGSRVMANWFGGGHPSQVMSARIRDGMESHLRDTLRLVNDTLGAPLVIKNAWNCFRGAYLAGALPEANFVWIRRDIGVAAKSDLAARYVVQGSPNIWNSATPANVEPLRRRPYWEQVVENQFEFNNAIGTALCRLPHERWIEIWYEDLIADPQRTITAIGERLRLLKGRSASSLGEELVESDRAAPLSAEDTTNVDRYVAEHVDRLRKHLRAV